MREWKMKEREIKGETRLFEFDEKELK